MRGNERSRASTVSLVASSLWLCACSGAAGADEQRARAARAEAAPAVEVSAQTMQTARKAVGPPEQADPAGQSTPVQKALDEGPGKAAPQKATADAVEDRREDRRVPARPKRGAVRAKAAPAPSAPSEAQARPGTPRSPSAAPAVAEGSSATRPSSLEPSAEGPAAAEPPAGAVSDAPAPQVESQPQPVTEAPPPSLDCQGWSERPSRDPRLKTLVHQQVRALVEGSPDGLPWPRGKDLVHRLRVARASGTARNLPPGDVDVIAPLLAKDVRRDLVRAFRRARQAADEAGLDWKALRIARTETFEACKHGTIEGAGRVTLVAGDARYTLWVEDLVLVPSGWRAGSVSAPEG